MINEIYEIRFLNFAIFVQYLHMTIKSHRGFFALNKMAPTGFEPATPGFLYLPA